MKVGFWSNATNLMLVLLLLMTGGCNWLFELRSFLRDEVKPSAVETGLASLRIEVEPAQNMTLKLNEKVVAKRSPYEKTSLAPGKYLVHVSAPKHHPFILGLDLSAGEKVVIPLALRPLQALGGDFDSFSQGQATTLKNTGIQEKVATAAAEIIGRDVIKGPAIELLVRLNPVSEIRLDGQVVAGKKLFLKRRQGQLEFGKARLNYRLTPPAQLRYVVVDDGGVWQKGAVPIGPGARIRHDQGMLFLRRQGIDGSSSTIVLKR
jgi:hypothetical protein